MRITHRLLSLAAYRVSWRVRAGGALRRAAGQRSILSLPIHPGDRLGPRLPDHSAAIRDSAGAASSRACSRVSAMEINRIRHRPGPEWEKCSGPHGHADAPPYCLRRGALCLFMVRQCPAWSALISVYAGQTACRGYGRAIVICT